MDQSLATLEEEIRFDRHLKHKYQTRDDEEALAAKKFHKTYLNPLKNFAIVMFYMIIPMM